MSDCIIDAQALLKSEQPVPWRQSDRIVLVGGCFDVLHLGHLAFLKKSKAQGDILVVALESDEFVRMRKGREPFHTQDQRAQVLTHIKSVDYILKLPLMETGEAYQALVQAVHPAVIAITAGDPVQTVKEKLAAEVGGKLVEVTGLIDGFSSSHILTYAHIMHD